MKALRRNYYFWRADVHLLSFPKCGRTWVRLMLRRIIEAHFGLPSRDTIQLHKLASRRRGIPAFLATHDFQTVRHGNKQPELETDKSRFNGKRVLFLIRDPRDVAVSFYYHKRFREQSFQGTIGEFIRQEFDGLATVIDYYNIWARNRHIPAQLHIVRYEDLRFDTIGTMRGIVDFAGLSGVSDAMLRQVVDEFEFNRMKKMEATGELGDSKTRRPTDPANHNSYKTRAGVVGGYRDELPGDDLAFANAMVAARLDNFYAVYKTS